MSSENGGGENVHYCTCFYSRARSCSSARHIQKEMRYLQRCIVIGEMCHIILYLITQLHDVIVLLASKV